MGGIHVAYRKTSSQNYVAVNSQLTLPTSYGCRENTTGNDGKVYNGAFPEFFHGFYVGMYGLDIGVVYKDGKFRLALYSFENTTEKQWYPSNGFTVPSDKIVTLSSYFSNGYLVTRCKNSSGTVIDSLDVYLKPSAYTALSQGSEIHRELVIAVNKGENGNYNVPAPAYFSKGSAGVKFSKTTLTSSSGSYVVLSTSNSELDKNVADLGISKTTYQSYIKSVTETGGFIADLANATLDKTSYPVPALS